MKNYAKYAVFIALATIAAVSVLRGRAAVAGGDLCSNSACYSAAPGFGGALWRMEVLVDEAAFRAPSVRDRLSYNWTNAASRRYRWTSIVMPVDTGTSTQLATLSAAVIAAGVPLLEKGDIVDVYAGSQEEVDYSKGRAPIVVRRACSVRDESCIDELRRIQNGRVSGVEIRCDQAATYWKPSPPLPNLGSALSNNGCRGELAAAPQ